MSQPSQLAQLKQMTKVVADTGQFELIKQFLPADSTTNPSLVLQAVKKPEYKKIMDNAVDMAKKMTSLDITEQIDWACDYILVLFGVEILKIVPGRVSTEIDARLSFDTEATVAKGRQLIRRYEECGVNRDRILLKIAATWEGIRAAKILEKDGIHTNVTLIFSDVQAIASAEAGATLVSPFVGRILDWYRKNTGQDYTPSEDPGCKSVSVIYNEFQKRGFKTEVMGASFRNKGEILELAGVSLLTISPQLMAELDACLEPVTRKLFPSPDPPVSIPALTESQFRWGLNQDAMATEKLAEGIRKFADDIVILEGMVQSIINI